MYLRGMARGNRTVVVRGLGAHRRTARTGATPEALAEIKRGFDQVIADAEARADAKASRRVRAHLTRVADPAPHTTTPAIHQYKAADAAFGGGPKMRAQFPQLVADALDAQVAHIEHLNEQVAAGGDVQHLLSELFEAQRLLGLMDTMRADAPNIERHAQTARRREVHGHANAVLREHLIAGDLDAARWVIQELRARDSGATCEALEPDKYTHASLEVAARLARAQGHVGLRPDLIQMIAHQAPQQTMRALRAEEAAGDDAERLLGAGSRRLHLPPAATPERVLATARAMLRTPERFNTTGDPGAGRGVRLMIDANVNTIARMLRDDTMAGTCLDVIVHDRSASPRGAKRHVSVEVRYAYAADSPRVISVIGELGHTTAKRARDGAWIRAQLTKHDAMAISEMGYIYAGDDDAIGGGPIRTATIHHLGEGEAERLAVAHVFGTQRNEEAILGPDICAHTNATWTEQESMMRPLGSRAPSAACLGCPDCLRSRLAVEPLHRFPDGHPMRTQIAIADAHGLAEVDTPAYVAWRRFYDELSGRAPASSVKELTERDGLIDPDPAAYLSAPRAPQRPTSPGKRVRTIADAMNRR